MSVNKRIYRPYAGRYTSEKMRFLVLPRYAFSTMFDSRFLLAFFVACNIPTLLFIATIYISHNPLVQATLQLKGTVILNIDNSFFERFLRFQGALCFMLAAWVGPGLISADLSNDALPLYLARPFSRTEYVLGKFTVLGALLSLITWIPGLLMFAVQADLAGWAWFSKSYWISGSMVLGSCIWIALVSLMALAFSAWIKWRLSATALMLGVFFALAGFGEAVNEILRTKWGKIFNLPAAIQLVWLDLFQVPMSSRFRGGANDLPSWAAWAVLLTFTSFCLLMLNRKLKAREVVR
jgi:ABC-2 type transport system permease protein